ncbi:hypothetical protein DERF_008552 [Dermatophagoides farinae]|uniref:Uncharacterized protein n=1 Tax=Dermatophagoides farinae TaxID=6954 RepID=A0A922I4Q0_DERFA|nr:hypothetical protein DERF_008552 [Dermatophagoides farinae]
MDWSFFSTVAEYYSSEDTSKLKEFIDENWNKWYRSDTEKDIKQYYRCNKVKKNDIQCRARIFISYDKFSESIYLYQNNEDHTCSEIISTSNRLTKELKNKITSMYEEKQKPKQIYEKLKGEGNVLKQTLFGKDFRFLLSERLTKQKNSIQSLCLFALMNQEQVFSRLDRRV